MGNAAATPISAKECEKYGISISEVHEYNAVVKATKKQSRGKKMEKKDLDKIHKYCINTKKIAGKESKNLHKLLEKQLNLDDPSVCLQEDHTSVTRTVTESASFADSRGGFVPSMIDLGEEFEDLSVMCDPTVAPPPKTADC